MCTVLRSVAVNYIDYPVRQHVLTTPCSKISKTFVPCPLDAACTVSQTILRLRRILEMGLRVDSVTPRQFGNERGVTTTANV